jgi:hypothetical protein
MVEGIDSNLEIDNDEDVIYMGNNSDDIREEANKPAEKVLAKFNNPEKEKKSTALSNSELLNLIIILWKET